VNLENIHSSTNGGEVFNSVRRQSAHGGIYYLLWSQEQILKKFPGLDVRKEDEFKSDTPTITMTKYLKSQ